MWVSCTASCRLCVDPDMGEGKPKNDLIDAYEGESDSAGIVADDSNNGSSNDDGDTNAADDSDEPAGVSSAFGTKAARSGGDGAGASKAESEVDVMDELTEDDISNDKSGDDGDGADVDEDTKAEEEAVGAEDGEKGDADASVNKLPEADPGDVSEDEEVGSDETAGHDGSAGGKLAAQSVNTADGGDDDREKACEDADASCPIRAKAGKCGSEPVAMRRDCPKSCDLCSEPNSCVDNNKLCNEWAASGECTKNPGYMFEGCPVSCNTCNKLGVETKMDASAWSKHPLARILTITTPQGKIDICLRPDNAPKTVAAIVEALTAASGETPRKPDGEFYRTEPVPDPLKGEPIAGPPYALLQGSLHGLPSSLAKEGFMQARCAPPQVPSRMLPPCIHPRNDSHAIALLGKTGACLCTMA
eukprot:jgi/Mesvir1/16458/Mv03878-RA.2